MNPLRPTWLGSLIKVQHLINQLMIAQSKGRQFILRFLNRPRNHEADNMALVYWTRSARQANIDSLVKMGDWYLYGYGLPSPDPAKAAACYQAAVESMSALGMWNLGWCHENGIGVEQDFHLAKRYYDLAAMANAEAALPVALSLINCAYGASIIRSRMGKSIRSEEMITLLRWSTSRNGLLRKP